MGLTRQIGEFVAGVRFDRLPPDSVKTVCLGFTDCVAVMMPGWAEPVSHITARGLGYVRNDRPNRALHGVQAPAPDLALLYGVAAHALDYDDTALLGHPSAVLVSAILAEANEVGADGKAMIAAYVAGYETWAELIRRDHNQHHAKGWHPSAVFGALAAAAARLASQARRRAVQPRGRNGGVARRRHRGEFRIDDQAAAGRARRPVRPDRDPPGRSRHDLLARRHRARPWIPAGDLAERRGRHHERCRARHGVVNPAARAQCEIVSGVLCGAP